MHCRHWMRSKLLLLAPLALATTLLGARALSAPQEAAGGPPGPGQEHKFLEKYVGDWDATITMSPGPGLPSTTSEATAKVRLACGGLWLVTDFEGTLMGAPFFGHEVTGYDPVEKKYVLNWVDSMSPSFVLGTGTLDPKGTSLEAIMHGRDPAGAPATWRQVDAFKDKDSREWTMYQTGADGKEIAQLQITYRRRAPAKGSAK